MFRVLGRRAVLLATAGALVVSGAVAATAATERDHDGVQRADPELVAIGSATLPETTRGVLDLAVSRDGTRAVAVSDHWLQVLSLTGDDPQLLGVSTSAFGRRVALSKDGRTAYVLSEQDTLYVVDVGGTGEPRTLRELYRGQFTPSPAFDIEISRNGRFLYVKHGYEIGGFGSGKGIQVLSLAKPRKPRRTAHANGPEWGGTLAVSRNGRHLATTSTTTDDYVLLYRVPRKRPKPKRVKRLRLPFAADAITISQDNRFAYALSGSTTTPLALARINLKKRKLVKTVRLGAYEDGLGLEVSPDGRYLYASMWRALPEDQPSFLVLDAKTLQPLHDAASPDLYAPQTVEVSYGGATKGRIYVPTYTGIMGGNPLLFALRYS